MHVLIPSPSRGIECYRTYISSADYFVFVWDYVQELSMQPDNRVVLTCVGGRDSYAVFEAANEDAAAVLYVGESAHL